MIGMGRLENNLYILNQSVSTCSPPKSIVASLFHSTLSFCNQVSQTSVWHCRLGHPSLLKLHQIKSDLGLKEVVKHDRSLINCDWNKKNMVTYDIYSNTTFLYVETFK